jgi:predicted phage baseplate assembly protein
VYRNGIGQPGNVQAKQISMLVSRPLGVKDVINPLRASGGADKEARDQARKNVPLAVTALDRLVSVQDYADFTRTFAGIAKASARPLSDGRRELVHITIAGVDDIPIDPSSDLYRNLLKALHNYGDPDLPVRVAVRELLLLVVSAKVYLQADYVWEKVVSDVRATLLDTFSFDRRELGQDAVLGEVLATMQAVSGVAYVDVDIFDAIPEKITDAGARRLRTPQEISDIVHGMVPPPSPRVRADLANNSGGVLQAAQLAFLSPLVPDTLILNRG